jgi:hypothetical protein
MWLSCGNTLAPPERAAPLGCGAHIRRFRRSSVVHGQDSDESKLTAAKNPRSGQGDIPVSTRSSAPVLLPG